MRYFLFIFLFVFPSCKGNNNVPAKDAKLSDSLNYVGKALLQRDELDSAELAIKEALRLDPSNHAAYNNRAYLKAMRKRPSNEVIADYEKALELNPFYDRATFSLANYYHQIKDWDNTIKWSNRYFTLLDREKSDSSDRTVEWIRKDAEKKIHQSN